MPDLDDNGDTTFDKLYIQQYLYDRSRYGFAGAVDYKLAENSDLYTFTACSRTSEISVRNSPIS